MQKILELQRQLKEVQQKQVNQAHKLNERNIVDIIQRLLQDNKIRLNYTNDGKEYFTNEKLEKEIKDLLSEMGGRINTLEIPHHVNVNMEIVDRAIENITKKSKVNLINGQLISSFYVDTILEELNE